MQNLARPGAFFLVASLFTASLAFAQNPATCNGATIPVCSPGSPSGAVQIKPIAVPTSTTAVTTYDAYLKEVVVVNTTSGALTFTLADGQSSPIAVMKVVSVAANTTYILTFPSLYWCPAGFTVLASSTGLNFYASWIQ